MNIFAGNCISQILASVLTCLLFLTTTANANVSGSSTLSVNFIANDWDGGFFVSNESRTEVYVKAADQYRTLETPNPPIAESSYAWYWWMKADVYDGHWWWAKTTYSYATGHANSATSLNEVSFGSTGDAISPVPQPDGMLYSAEALSRVGFLNIGYWIEPGRSIQVEATTTAQASGDGKYYRILDGIYSEAYFFSAVIKRSDWWSSAYVMEYYGISGSENPLVFTPTSFDDSKTVLTTFVLDNPTNSVIYGAVSIQLTSQAIALSDVVLSPVPEAESAAMLALGVSLVGLAVRRRMCIPEPQVGLGLVSRRRPG